MKVLPVLLTDSYKQSHIAQYPQNTTLVYSNWTPRGSRVKGVNRVVFFGLQYFIKEYLINQFNENFFNRPKQEVVDEFVSRLECHLGVIPNTDHIEALHDLGYLPIRIDAVQEGTTVALRNPMLTIWNTKPEFFWLTNSLETLMSNVLWMPCTSATTALQYNVRFHEYAEKTGGSEEFIPFQGHDFSMRGMSSVEAACASGAGHLLSFFGTDTIPAIEWLEKYYNTDRHNETIGVSVPATEHSVMCMGTKHDEISTFRRLINEIYPTGIVSIVSDTWDFWKVITEFLPTLKDEIMARQGKVVIRPDSGDPVSIICGVEDAIEENGKYYTYQGKIHGTGVVPGSRTEIPEHVAKGAIECMWETFGGTTNDKGFKTLDEHIGLIYGDSITLERQEAILRRLAEKGFASDNIVLGIGSYTYQCVTRDTYGFAMKATYGEVNGVGRNIFKDPVTDGGEKKSAKGLLRLEGDNLLQEVTWAEQGGDMTMVFCDGFITRDTSLEQVRIHVEEEMCHLLAERIND